MSNPAQGNATEPIHCADESTFGLSDLGTADGLRIRALPNGCIYSIEYPGLLLNQVLASPLGGGVHRIYLRVHGETGIRFIEMVGPGAISRFTASPDRFLWNGSWDGLHYRCTCWLHPTASTWFIGVGVENQSGKPVRCDAVCVQDVGLATRGQVRNNELFTSQYIDHFAMNDRDAGYVVMSRQNLPQTTPAIKNAHPWLMQGCLPGAKGFTTDGFDFFGVGFKNEGVAGAICREIIGNQIRQYEAGYVAIQSSGALLPPSESSAWTFFAHFMADHPDRSSSADLARLQAVRAARADAAIRSWHEPAPVAPGRERSRFQTCELFIADDLDPLEIARLFPGAHRHEESQGNDALSFFVGDDSRHVTLRAKELRVERPHGHIMRSGIGFIPDAELMSCTCYAPGVFASQLALGNASAGKLLSGIRDRLNLVRSSGLRIMVRERAGQSWKLLGVPSAFEMAQHRCRWFYKRGQTLLTIDCNSSDIDPAFTFDIRVEGSPVEMMITGEIAAGPAEYDHSAQLTFDQARRQITIRPDTTSLLGQRQPGIVYHVVTATPESVDAMGGDELLVADGSPRRLPYIAIRTKPATHFNFTFVGTLNDPQRANVLCEKYRRQSAPSTGTSDTPRAFWSDITACVSVTSTTHAPSAWQIHDTLAWFARDALIHLSTPRGLEQPNGGAWGVRDVCQGSIEFLLTYDHVEVAAEVIRRVFSQQYLRRGDWPQWFMFRPYEQIQASDCHGDILIWPLKALCDYLEHSNDLPMLQQRVPYTDDASFQPTDSAETILSHVDRLIAKMHEQFLPGTSLPRYGEGDWDDSLQPADAHLRERMVSSWTAALMYQTLRRYGALLSHAGDSDRAAGVGRMAEAIASDFQRHLISDGVVAGFAIFGEARSDPVEYLLHPSDQRTGLRYRLIPMTRGILAGIFSPEQAAAHLELIEQHLVFPDGARLMDRPTAYHGGLERTFRRSESAAFFGREIGLQYVHAHLRYAEALAMMGKADALWRALRVVNPIAVTQIVNGARLRQRNCYFSSSDAVFADRYQASRDYEKLRTGEVSTDAGWRIYSSGPGIYTSLIIRNLFGLRQHFDFMEFDPVLPRELDGVRCDLQQFGRRVCYEFRVRSNPCSPSRISINGTPLDAIDRAPNPYRIGGLRIRKADFVAALTEIENHVRIEI